MQSIKVFRPEKNEDILGNQDFEQKPKAGTKHCFRDEPWTTVIQDYTPILGPM